MAVTELPGPAPSSAASPSVASVSHGRASPSAGLQSQSAGMPSSSGSVSAAAVAGMRATASDRSDGTASIMQTTFSVGEYHSRASTHAAASSSAWASSPTSSASLLHRRKRNLLQSLSRPDAASRTRSVPSKMATASVLATREPSRSSRGSVRHLAEVASPPSKWSSLTAIQPSSNATETLAPPRRSVARSRCTARPPRPA
mmetsp:Transcript_90343/g.255460  ORF Transcript_90343/g.255460 Transcript_90343/m.255460 type:complete len:201 (-) Transcript_90343:1779-2381(-)